jgi:tetratricopeptide (TPR) repeat protein
MDVIQRDSERLKRDVEGALQRALDPSDVLPMLHRLSRAATPGSDESVFAHRQLAELLLERHPWRAALHAKRVLAAQPRDDRGWAALAACQAMLGHYRFAAAAYERALESAPQNPSYAHNLGHLLDVALGRPRDAIPWLRLAFAARPGSAEVAASYAHGLARAGDLEEAKRVLDRATSRGAAKEHAALRRWLDKGAPPRRLLPPLRPPTLADGSSAPGPERAGTAAATRRGRPGNPLDSALARGLARLPVGPVQRGRALALARDAAPCLPKPPDPSDIQNLAAAIAYAIVFVDHVPLTQAEVAACFRVSASALRARFKDLRLRLDLTPGDARYATLRRS